MRRGRGQVEMRFIPSRWTARAAVVGAGAVAAVVVDVGAVHALWLDLPAWDRLCRSAAGAARGSEPVTLRVAWLDHSGRGIPAKIVGAELQHALGPDVRVAWRPAGRDRAWAEPEVAVIALDTVPPGNLSARAMGAAQANGRALWLFLSNVAWSLGMPEGGGILSMSHRVALARAAGRVVAHEVTHLVGGLGHAPLGLMRAQLDRQTLLTARLRLDAGAARTLRDCVVRWNEGAPCAGAAPAPVAVLVSPDARTGTRTAAP